MMQQHPRERVSVEERQAIEHLANFVKSSGHALEQVVRDRSRDDPKFRFDDDCGGDNVHCDMHCGVHYTMHCCSLSLQPLLRVAV